MIKNESSVSPRSLVVFALGIAAFFVVIAFTLWQLVDIWLLCFGGVLLAVGLHGAGDRLSRWTSWPVNRSTALLCILMMVSIVIGAWIFGPPLISGLSSLEDRLPDAIDEMKRILSTYP